MIVLEKGEVITSRMIEKHLFIEKRISSPNLPIRIAKSVDQAEREMIIQQIFLIRRELQEIKDAIINRLFTGQYEKLYPYRITPPNQYRFDEEKEIMEVEESEAINPEMLGKVSLEEAERELIKRTLKKFNFKKRQTANSLKISERTLYRKIKQYGFERNRQKS